MSSESPQDNFYSNLDPFENFGDVARDERYHAVPDSWFVAVTDIEGSTQAIEEGRYKEVNAIGAGSIVAALNAVGDIDLPYVFGGDGATILLPPNAYEAVRGALAGVGSLAQTLFGLDLRVGIVPVSEIRERGGELSVAKYRLSQTINLAMLAGGGAELAETIVKHPVDGEPWRLSESEIEAAAGRASLDGFHCRWNPIQSRRGHMVSLMVVASGDADRHARSIYTGVLDKIRSFGRADELRPVVRESLDVATSPSDHAIEAGMYTGRTDGIRAAAYRVKTSIRMKVGKRLMKSGGSFGGFDGTRYPNELVANTDFRKFDDALRMVIDLDEQQLAELRAYLRSERDAGRLAYGIHSSETALMTCLVLNYEGEHVHFVDGAEGGYALAARQLKEQLRGKRDRD